MSATISLQMSTDTSPVPFFPVATTPLVHSAQLQHPQ